MADGFYEWKKAGKTKTPFYFHLKSRKPFGFAGLFEDWPSPEGTTFTTCTILTTRPNPVVEKVHNRMPVILRSNLEEAWLDPEVTNPDIMNEIFDPFPPDEMDSYAVDTKVNMLTSNGPDLIKFIGGG